MWWRSSLPSHHNVLTKHSAQCGAALILTRTAELHRMHKQHKSAENTMLLYGHLDVKYNCQCRSFGKLKWNLVTCWFTKTRYRTEGSIVIDGLD